MERAHSASSTTPAVQAIEFSARFQRTFLPSAVAVKRCLGLVQVDHAPDEARGIPWRHVPCAAVLDGVLDGMHVQAVAAEQADAGHEQVLACRVSAIRAAQRRFHGRDDRVGA